MNVIAGSCTQVRQRTYFGVTMMFGVQHKADDTLEIGSRKKCGAIF